jgi:hypothetical protein
VAEEQLTEDELRERLEAELKRLKVSDLLLQMISAVSSLGYRRLLDEDRDLEQGRLAIESLRALVPVLEGAVPTEAIRELNQLTANLQLAYAKAVSETPASPEGGSERQSPEDAAAEREDADENG